jgi:hypothetical protein
VPDSVYEFKSKVRELNASLRLAEKNWSGDGGSSYRLAIERKYEYYENTKEAWYKELSESESSGNKKRYNVLRKMIADAFTKYADGTTIKGVVGKTYICEKEGRIEVYSGSDVRSAEVMEGDEFVVTEDLSKIYYLGKLRIKGKFKLSAGLSGKDVSGMSYGNQDEILYLLRKENIGGNSDFFAQFKADKYAKGSTVKGGVGEDDVYDIKAKEFWDKMSFEDKRKFSDKHSTVTTDAQVLGNYKGLPIGLKHSLRMIGNKYAKGGNTNTCNYTIGGL